MARIRSVHPSICQSEDMADLPAEVERTFVRLWTHCDDEGRAKDNARLIKAAIYPLHDDMTAKVVDEHLAVLAERGHIVRYEVDGKRLLAVVEWKRYQHPQKARDSDLPPPPDPVPAPSRDGRVALRDEDAVGDGVGEGDGDGVGEGDRSPAAPAGSCPTPVEAVFAAWQEATGKPRAVLDPKRRRLIADRLKTYPVEDLVDAVRGWRHSPFHCGENDRRTVYNSLDLLLRNAEKVEHFRDLERHGPPRAGPRGQSLEDMAAEVSAARRGGTLHSLPRGA